MFYKQERQRVIVMVSVNSHIKEALNTPNAVQTILNCSNHTFIPFLPQPKLTGITAHTCIIPSSLTDLSRHRSPAHTRLFLNGVFHHVILLNLPHPLHGHSSGTRHGAVRFVFLYVDVLGLSILCLQIQNILPDLWLFCNGCYEKGEGKGGWREIKKG